jgi:exopolysaccharide production protein ExoQ
MPTTTAIRSMTIPSKRPIPAVVLSWVLMLPLLVFASQWGFSFEHGAMNTAVGGRAGGATAIGQGDSIAMKVQSAVVYLCCAFLIVPFIRPILADFSRDLLIASFPVLAFLSAMWSQFPLMSLVHAVMLAANMAFAFYLLERFSINDLLRLLLMVGTIAAIGSLFFIVLLPQYGLQNRNSIAAGAWEGIFGQKNTCGIVLTYLLLPAFFVQIKSRSARVFRGSYIAVLIVIIAMTRSANGWIDCAGCILFVVTMRFMVRMSKMQILAIVFIIAGIAAIAGVYVFSHFDQLMYAIGKDPTLTGRTIIWSSVLTSVKKHPLFGYGYMAFWASLLGESANTVLLMHWPGMAYAENGILELALELGVVGVVLYLLLFFRAVKDAAYLFMRKPSPAAMWYISYLAFTVVSNIGGGRVMVTSDLMCILTVIVFAGLRRETRRVRLRRKHEEQNDNVALNKTLRLSGAGC